MIAKTVVYHKNVMPNDTREKLQNMNAHVL